MTEGLEIILLVVLVLALIVSLALNIYQYRRKPKPRPDLASIEQALADLSQYHSALIELRRVDPQDVLIWGRR